MEYRFTLAEQETLVRYDAVDRCWYADTNIGRDYKKFKEQGWEVEKEELYSDGSFKYAKFKADRSKAIRICAAKKKEYTDEELATLRDRVQKAMQAKKEKNDKKQ